MNVSMAMSELFSFTNSTIPTPAPPFRLLRLFSLFIPLEQTWKRKQNKMGKSSISLKTYDSLSTSVWLQVTSLRRGRGFSQSSSCFLLFQIPDMEQSTITGSEKGPKPERQQLVQRKLNLKCRLCRVCRISEGRGSRAGAPWRRRPGCDCHLLGLTRQLQARGPARFCPTARAWAPRPGPGCWDAGACPWAGEPAGHPGLWAGPPRIPWPHPHGPAVSCLPVEEPWWLPLPRCSE